MKVRSYHTVSCLITYTSDPPYSKNATSCNKLVTYMRLKCFKWNLMSFSWWTDHLLNISIKDTGLCCEVMVCFLVLYKQQGILCGWKQYTLLPKAFRKCSTANPIHLVWNHLQIRRIVSRSTKYVVWMWKKHIKLTSTRKQEENISQQYTVDLNTVYGRPIVKIMSYIYYYDNNVLNFIKNVIIL